jgi:tyrosyl-tRNA synthetase
MTLYDELSWRGFVHQTTDPELGDRLERQRFTAYCGFDPTSDSLHVGSLLPIIGLMRLQRAGHKPVALVGGSTGMIGDPSFKAEERRLLDDSRVARNVAGIRSQLERFLDFDGPHAAVLLNNADWLGSIRLIPFLRDVGKHFSVNMMIAKESVRARLEDRDHGISYTEFSYLLLQAFDYLHLYDSLGCTLQVGGSDQWGNIVAGIDLIRRLRNDEAYGLTFPLLTKSDGTKFGKTEGGNVWLDAARTSPYKFYQFWLNQADADTPRLLRLFTFLVPAEIEDLEQLIDEAPERRAAQRALAEELTRMVHGPEGLEAARRASKALFGGELSGLDDRTLEDIFDDMPSCDLPRAALTEERPLVEVLVQCGVFKSKGEARRLMENGGLYVNNERVGPEARLTEEALASPHIAVVRKGKKHYHLLRFE